MRGHWSDTLVVAGALLLFLASLAMPIVAVAWLWHAVSGRGDQWARKRSASMAAMQPVPAAVTAWR